MNGFRTIEAFKPHFDALTRIAYFKIFLWSTVSPRAIKVHNICRVLVWGLVLTYNLQHILNVILNRHNTERIVDTLFILLTTLNTLGKQLAFNIRSDRIERVMNVVNGNYFSPSRPNHVALMKANALVMARLLKLYIVAIFTCGTLWTLFPFVNRANGEQVRFSAYFPYDTNLTPMFEVSVAYLSILITFQAYGNVTMDCMIVSFYAQAKLQLQMLRDNLEHLLKTEDTPDAAKMLKSVHFDDPVVCRYKDLDNNFEQTLQRRFAHHVEHYQLIAWFINEIESIFAEALFFQFLVTAWVICMTVYKIVDLSVTSLEFISMAMYLICMLAQFFIYCYYGTQLKVESEFVNDSIYKCQWLSLSPRFRRQLVIMMERCSRPLAPRIAQVVPISLETYIAVLRSSYTLFTFLNSRK